MRKYIYCSIIICFFLNMQIYANDFSNNKTLMEKFKSENLQGKNDILFKLNKEEASKNVELIKFFINEYKKLPIVKGKYSKFSEKEQIIAAIKRSIIYIVYDYYKLNKDIDTERFLEYVRQITKSYGCKIVGGIDSQLNNAVDKKKIELVKFKDFSDDREIMEKFKSANYIEKEYILGRLEHRKGKRSENPGLVKFFIDEYKKLPIIPDKYRDGNLGDIPDKEKQIGGIKIPIIIIVRESYKQDSNKDAEQFIKNVRQRKEAYVSNIFNIIDNEDKREEEYNKFEKQKKQLQELSDKKLINMAS